MDSTSKETSKENDADPPSAPNGEQTEPLRSAAVCSCGAGLHATDPYRCARGHAIGGNPLARKHPVNERRVEQLLGKYVRDYHPDTQRLQSMCEQFAAVTEQLEGRKADGSANYQRLVQLSQTLGAALEESRSREIRAQTDLDTLSEDELIERTAAILHQLLESRDAQRKVQVHIAQAYADHQAGASSEAAVDPAGDAATPTPAPVCPYCHRACVGPEHFAYDVLHYDDPIEVAKRDAEATAVMCKQIGKPFWL